MKFEDSALYVSEEHADYLIGRDAAWVSRTVQLARPTLLSPLSPAFSQRLMKYPG